MFDFSRIKINYVVLAILCALIVTSCGSVSNSKSDNSSNSSDDSNSSNYSQSDVIKRADGSVIKKGGYKASAPKKDAQKYKATIDASQLPAKVDLRPYMSPVEDQGLIGSCTANATAGAFEYLMWWHKQTQFDISRLFLYYNSRAIENAEDIDNGAMITDVMQALHDNGVCSEKSWPYIENKFTQRPPQNCYDEAKQYTISNYKLVDLDLNTWKSVLAEGYPIIFGICTYDAFDNPRNGFIPMPRNTSGDPGPHAMCCVGYSDPDRVFIVRNSWGHQWGDGGYCYIPYDYMMSPDYNDGDCWVLYSTDGKVDHNRIEEEIWDNDDKSIFVDMENEFTNMSDENWYAMCDELGDYDIVFRLGALYDFACWSDDDEEITHEEAVLAVEKLKKILVMFGLDYSPKKVMKHCQKLSLTQDNFLVETADILTKYLSEGARATIAADMLEICEADGEVSDGEREIILDLVGDWLNDDLIDVYYSDYYDEEEGDEYDYYDDEDDYYDEDDYSKSNI